MNNTPNGTPQVLVFLFLVALVTGGLFALNPIEKQLRLPSVAQPATPQAGRWVGVAFESGGADAPAMQLLMDVAEDGTLQGTLALYPLDLPDNAIDLVAANGCLVPFEALTTDDLPIRGVFVTPTQAAVQINVANCEVKFFGPITFDLPITGLYDLRYNEIATLSLLESQNRVLTPEEVGLGVFANYCSACHGNMGQGAPGVPSLMTEEIAKKTDAALLEIINLGVGATGMPAWGQILTEEEKNAVLLIIRNIDLLAQ